MIVGKYTVSVVIPTHNRHEKLAETVAGLQRQNLPREAYEILVMDDGSTPPVELTNSVTPSNCRVVRLEGIERSAARNAGARLAKGTILLFLDDDISVKEDFLAVHLRAQSEWPSALIVGAISLPAEIVQTPFGRFRQRLEQLNVPLQRGVVDLPNFCTAANMSIERELYFSLGGFNSVLHSAEDQELALRHSARGGRGGTQAVRSIGRFVRFQDMSYVAFRQQFAAPERARQWLILKVTHRFFRVELTRN